ncbi:MAG: hypothetical protein AB1352_01815 [Patescibacteria group bacterium]
MPPLHTDLAAGRWHTLSLAEQLGNIGSEAGRSLARWQEHDTERFASAFARALELFNLSITDPRWPIQRVRELARAREVFCDYFFGGNTYHSTPDSLEKYFYPYALLARKKNECQ